MPAFAAKERQSRIAPGPRITRDRGKSDAAALRWRWVHELADGREDGGDGLLVVLQLALQLVELPGERGVGSQEFAQAYEGADHKDAHLDGARLLRMVAAMMAPCSVKANGGNRGSRCFWEPVAICDRFRSRPRCG